VRETREYCKSCGNSTLCVWKGQALYCFSRDHYVRGKYKVKATIPEAVIVKTSPGIVATVPVSIPVQLKLFK
jgi:hypothetical protein